MLTYIYKIDYSLSMILSLIASLHSYYCLLYDVQTLNVVLFELSYPLFGLIWIHIKERLVLRSIAFNMNAYEYTAHNIPIHIYKFIYTWILVKSSSLNSVLNILL